MTPEGGFRAHPPTESLRPFLRAPASGSDFDAAMLRQALAEEDAIWEVLENQEKELQQFLQISSLTFEERQSGRADLESVGWLAEHWPDVQHGARALKDFEHWRQTPPSRSKLFASYCRHAIPAEWDRALAVGEPPFIFPTRERFDAHLEHCQLCGAQRQLAEGRRRRPAPDRLAWGDRWVYDFFTMFCGPALAAVCDPEPPARNAFSDRPRVWSDAPPWRLVVPPDARLVKRRNLEIEIPAQLVGPPEPFDRHGARLALIVAAQHIALVTRQAEAPQLVYPSPRGGDAFIDWPPTREGWQTFPLLVPAPAEPGRLILRYAVRLAAPTAEPAGETSAPITIVNALSVDMTGS